MRSPSVRGYTRRTTDEQRRTEQVLLGRKWMTLEGMPDVWWTSFTGKSHGHIVQTARKDIEEAVCRAGISEYEAAVHTGRGRPAVFGA